MSDPKEVPVDGAASGSPGQRAPEPEPRVVEHYPPPPDDELPPPTFRQALIGYGSIMLALVLLGLLVGLLMKVLR